MKSPVSWMLLSLLLTAGCGLWHQHRSECSHCQGDYPVQPYAPGDAHGPTPLVSPPPVPSPEAVPVPETVPELPGTAIQPGPLQRLRAETTTFFLNSRERVRSAWHR
ncbi:MAG: hypothetical protein KatS3mg113_1025 [Planctomycetaceae bacterium]|nr:MAG: hypothetical protein KatS3mg113_1025 [Planctomycetaceae bacterium]